MSHEAPGAPGAPSHGSNVAPWEKGHVATLALPSGSSTVLARRRERVSRLSCTLSCSIARSIAGTRPAGANGLTAPWPLLVLLGPWPENRDLDQL